MYLVQFIKFQTCFNDIIITTESDPKERERGRNGQGKGRGFFEWGKGRTYIRRLEK